MLNPSKEPNPWILPRIRSSLGVQAFVSSIMASACNRFVNRTSLASLKSAIKSKVLAPAFDGAATSTSSRVLLSNRSTSRSPLVRSSLLSRSPVELGSAQSLLPLHSAVAVARLTSCLSSNSRSCRALSQEFGLSVPR
ncbi:PREDICTED: uncharacterized protein LOC104598500 isoform X1 [Nelumbo nucifera]|uniref:Uncharacterized protein LOC104598500 isoform X1 n=1 Tax=Nelumbo nucifera TaxID=4432 RepID=A0A1U8AA31_NELNU|nr:PREDICTED: uncharacterized protein LOC104598500 isoform X1 [Nelumbo nucifera]